VVRSYLALSGQEIAPALADFYLSHRALTRAKLAAWRLVKPDGDHARWHARLQDYVRLAWNAQSAVDELLQSVSWRSSRSVSEPLPCSRR
jgi:aminoglycoside phosphotransferase family enzyme